MPESCVSEYRCGTAITMWMNGLHPQTADGIVSRGICGRQGVTCCAVSYTIRVKACPGNYYVYEFVSPICTAAYCADVNTITVNVDPTTATVTTLFSREILFVSAAGGVASDPCNDYSVLDEEWRVMYGLLYSIYRGHDDTVAKWSGWYRLYLQGNSAQIPEPDWCASYLTCGGYTPLLLGGAHPLPEDGIITRDVYGSYGYVIDSKLCNSQRSYPIQVKACPGDFYVYKLVQPTVGFPRPTYCAVALDTPRIDPCNSYTSLDQPWRGTNATGGANCDLSFNGTGWYRLMYKGMNIRMPETCVASSKCGTSTSLWLNGSHPQIEDGIVVLRLLIPITFIFLPNSTAIKIVGNIADPNITGSPECKVFTKECADILFSWFENITTQVLSPQVVTELLNMVVNTQEQILNVEALNTDTLVSYGNTVLNRTEKLMSMLVKPTETYYSVNISLNGLGSAAVAFMSYTNMAGMLKPSLFRTAPNTKKIMMSNVVSATLPKTVNTQLSNPVRFTLKHLTDIYSGSVIYCLFWNNTEWVTDGCEHLQTNISHTVCSCIHLSTFALIMQINPPTGDDSDPILDLLNTMAVAVGLVFLSLALLTFAICRRNLRVNIAPLINLCISLFLAHLLFLLTQEFLQYIQADQVACAVLAGVLHFLFLSAFVWMFIEAVLLFISVKNLTKIRSKQKEVLSWKYMTVIGYIIPLTVVGVSAGLFPDGYGSKQCWIRRDRSFVWSFLGPVYFILIFNLILFIIMIITLRTTLAGLNAEHSQLKQMKTLVFKTLIQIVILGCPWILGFFTQDSKVLEILFLFLNSQQGTFIFLVHCVFNHEVSLSTPVYFLFTYGLHMYFNMLHGSRLEFIDLLGMGVAKTPHSEKYFLSLMTVSTAGGVASDPCSDYSVLDEEWRVMYGLLYSIYRGHDDTVAKWSGWYRLYLQGNSAQIPEPDWCASYLTCGGYTPLLLGGAHPLPEDGIVTRDIYGSYGYVIDSQLCNSRRSYPIQVKACPGDYYVYKLVQPTVGFPRPTYCAVALNTPSIDPCNSYTSLDQTWRGTNATAGTNCDLSFNGTDWYRLMYKGMNIRMPETCVASSKCGTATSLWLNGSHPQIENGIVVLRVCGKSGTDCCYYRSTPVRVKACPGNYYVYQLFSTTFCDAAYCADVTTITPISTTTVASSTQSTTSTNLYMTNATTITPTTVASSTQSTTSTEQYMTNTTTITPTTTVTSSTELPTSTELYMTNATTTTSISTTALAISTEMNATNVTTITPTSTLTVANSTQLTTSTELYMTNATTITPTTTVASSTQSTTSTELYMTNTTTITPTTTVASSTDLTTSTELYTNPNIIEFPECKIFTMECADILFSRIGNITAEVLSPQVVTELLDMVVNTQEQILNVEALNTDTLVSYGNTVLNRTEKLMSLLVKPTDTNYSVNISLNGLDVQVMAVGPNASLTDPLQLRVNRAQMEIYLSQISMNNNGSAAVAFMSFTNMAGMLKPSLFRAATNTEKMMMSDVVSATLPKTANTQLGKPVKFTLKHLAEIHPSSVIYCVYWNDTKWVVDGCERLQTNLSHTVCSCIHLSTFALIMQINPPTGDNSDPVLDLLNTMAVAVGLVFLSLALLTFALCRRNLRVNIAPLINLCISLFLAHFLFLLTQGFLQHIQTDQVVCAVLAGVLHFLFLSAFVWMFIEAVLLFISVKNLTKIRSKQKEVLSWKYMTVIGYIIPLTVVGVSAGLFPDGYGSK
ncbi:hypothetical protein NFI96_019116, partial [Prochilodus magdalenae]